MSLVTLLSLARLKEEQARKCATAEFHRGYEAAVNEIMTLLDSNYPLPDGLVLPPEAEAHYRALMDDGFAWEWRHPGHPGQFEPAIRVWLAPTNEPLTREQIKALATLQEYGFGPIVSA